MRIKIQDMFENEKPDIVLKTVKRFDIIRTPILILIPENSFKLGIVVLVMLNKMLVGRFNHRLLLWIWAGILKNSVYKFVPITNT